jgi:signal transduction histidine kinase
MTNDNYNRKESTLLTPSQLNEIATAVMFAAEAGNVEQVLERIAEVSRTLVKARYAALGVPDGEGGLKFFKVAGMTEEAIARLDHLPYGHGLIGAIMRDRQALRVEHMADDVRSVGFCAHHPFMDSLLGVPIQIGQQLFGTLYLCDREDGQPFTQEDEWLIETMAGYAALAIAGSELSEQQSRLQLLEERERIGMELHDGVIQSLYAIGMHLDLMRLNEQATSDGLGQVIKELNNVIEDIRRYILNLHRGDHQQRTIYERLEDMLGRVYRPQNLAIHLDAPHDKPLFTPATFEAICQMANEAISNAVRHSKAENITIRTRQENNLFRITIADDGQGFDVNEVASHSGLGLRNIQQRAALHGGSVEIDSTPGRGTQLTIIIPVRIL